MAYQGFDNLVQKHGLSPALSAFIGRRKYGAKAFDKRAAQGKLLRGVRPVQRRRQNR